MSAVAGVAAVPQVAAAVPPRDGVTATPLACAPPPFVTVKVRVTCWLGFTVCRLAEIVTTSPAGGSERSEAVAGGLGTFWPEKVASPTTERPKSRCPAEVGTTIQVKVALAPAA